jgi:transposase
MDNAAIKKRFEKLAPHLDERLRRLVAGAEALAIGRGGITAVSREIGLCRESIRSGCLELENADKLSPSRIRKVGGGRKRTLDQDPTLKVDLERLVDPVTRGDPESPLRWTCKSTRQLADALMGMGHKTSHRMVAELLHELGYSLQSNRKTLEGNSHPDRNAQFEHIYQQVKCFQASGDPIISVDTKKKELVGQFKQAGQEWQPVGQPESVQVHDFPDVELGKVAPYGVYDPTLNRGWVNVGTDHDTSQFAVESIRRWWRSMGTACYPEGRRLLITADGGGSNGSRVRLWKSELQVLAIELGMPISVCHYPPGTSKWNNIEHRLFSYITLNWRGKPLVSHEVVVNLIASTTNRKGLQVHCELDSNPYPKGIKVTNDEMEALKLDRDEFHGEWNYTISP